MTVPSLVRWVVIAVAALGLTELYAQPLATRFLNDDYLFLEQANRMPLAQSLVSMGPLGNYYRPVSRQLYFETLAPIANGRPIVFHVVNYAIFLLALVLLADLLAAFLPLPGVCAGLLYFATLPFQRVNLMWISCSQDLLALAFSLAAIALFRRGKTWGAAVAYLLAVFSKESALPLPLVLAVWPDASPATASHDGVGRARLQKLAPFMVVAVIWIAVTLWMRSRAPGVAALLHFGPDSFLAAWLHEAQSLLGLDHPSGLLASLGRNGPAPLAMICFAAVIVLLPSPVARPGGEPPPRLAPGLVRFACVWLVAYGAMIGPVVATWSSYHYTLAAVGAALLVGGVFRRIGAAGWLLLVGGLLWLHAGATGVRAFAVSARPWEPTTHLSAFYFQRAAALTDTLGAQLRRLEPHPLPGTRFFFATLPPWAGFQMGNGAQVRSLYRDTTLASHFYSTFSESTAARHPVRFYHWNGVTLAPLFAPGTDTFFQVGSDLLAFDRIEGARYAFRRGLEEGENRVDHYYWLGWTELWLGRRAAAEAAWSSFGAMDDSLRWWIRMRAARSALLERGDTLDAKRQLAMAIRSGIGRPEAHAVLGELLLREHPKYGLLELKIAARLKPDDWVARRGIVLGLLGVGLDDQARAELEELKRIMPAWERDPTVQAAIATLERRSSAARTPSEVLKGAR